MRRTIPRARSDPTTIRASSDNARPVEHWDPVFKRSVPVWCTDGTQGRPRYRGGTVTAGETPPEENTHTAWLDRAHSLDASIRRYSR